MKIVIEVTQEEFNENQYRLKDYGYEIIEKAYRTIKDNRLYEGVTWVPVAEIKVV